MSRRDLPRQASPEGIDDPVFSEPWQAEAFAMVLALHHKGLFSWSEWAEMLSAELKQPGVAADGSDYYDCWLRAFESLLAAKGLAARQDVDALAAAWQRAAHATPHGMPILLDNDPERAKAEAGRRSEGQAAPPAS